ncbi:MAG: aminotransferase class III-fold pyridoxal phosphate-dependent enzyme [Candidatus Eremiobacteraeota bacterium]|nr:aminotransferase class III-fold pyridoxal phosphate-dependent enzyme [Candidatus Eremiobacteraeota bacterium]
MLTAETKTRSKHSQYVLTPWSAQGALDMPTIDHAQGSWLYDTTGKKYLDLSAGLVAVNLGHGHPTVVRAIADQAAKLCYAAPSFFNDLRAAVAQELVALTPWTEGGRTFFTTGGGEANEDAVKMSRMMSGRHKVLAAYRSFHGSAPGAGTLSGENRRWPNEPGIPGVVHFFAPFPYRSPFHTDKPAEETRRALEHLELVLTYEDPARVAAILLEPIVGSNGVIVYPDGYLDGVREICDRYGIFLIFDEVMTGFGRVGASFACRRFGITPDLITFAKGCTSAYVPLGGVIVRERLASYFDDHVLGCGHTYSGHPLAIAAAHAALKAYRDDELYGRALLIEGWMHDLLGGLRAGSPLVGDVRGMGAFFALDLVRDRATREPIVPWQGSNAGIMPALLKSLRQRGVYAFGRYNVILVTPPLTISRDDLAFGVDALSAALAEVGNAL